MKVLVTAQQDNSRNAFLHNLRKNGVILMRELMIPALYSATVPAAPGDEKFEDRRRLCKPLK